MDARSAIDAAINLAKVGAAFFPTLGKGAALAEKTLDILDDLKTEAPPQTAEEAEKAHQELYDAMTAKGHALSARLRG